MKSKKYRLNKKTFALFILKAILVLIAVWCAASYIDIMSKNLNTETTNLMDWNIVKLLFVNWQT